MKKSAGILLDKIKRGSTPGALIDEAKSLKDYLTEVSSGEDRPATDDEVKAALAILGPTYQDCMSFVICYRDVFEVKGG